MAEQATTAVIEGVGYNDQEAQERAALEQAADHAAMAVPSLRFRGGRTWGDANWVLEARLGDRPGRALLTVHRFHPADESAAPAAYHEPHVLRFRIALQDPLHGGDDAPRTASSPAEAAGVLQDWASLPDEPFRRALQAPPLDLGDLERLRILAAARRDARGQADSLVIVDTPFRERDGDPADWAAAAHRLIAENFPRDPDGALTPGQVVALCPRDEGQPVGERGPWYVATGPRLRRDPQMIRLSWETRIGENHAHRWDETPWLWNPDAALRAPDSLRWGVDGLPLSVLGFSPDFSVPPEADNATQAGRVTRTLRLQDSGHLPEALALWGVEPSDRVMDLLAGVEARHERDHSEAVREAVRRAALWRWPELVSREEGRLEAWRQSRRGRAFKPAALKLFFLPNQAGASRAALFLGAREDGSGAPRLYVDSTAYEASLPAALWLRPVDLDLRRFGME